MPATASKRERILTEALAILRESGSARPRMVSPADRCAISLGNLQYHFKTREVLLAALLEYFLSECEARSRKFLAGASGSDAEKLTALLAFGLEDPDYREWMVIFKELWALAEHSPELKAALQQYYDDYFRGTVDMLRPLAGGGESAGELERIVAVVMAFAEGYHVVRDSLPVDGKTLAATIGAFVQQAFAGSSDGSSNGSPD